MKILLEFLHIFFICFVCFCFVWAFTFHSRTFYSYGDITITGEELLILTYDRCSWPLSSDGSLVYHKFCDTWHHLKWSSLRGQDGKMMNTIRWRTTELELWQSKTRGINSVVSECQHVSPNLALIGKIGWILISLLNILRMDTIFNQT